MNTVEWIVMLIIFIPICTLLIAIPYLTRQTEAFGVSIPREVYASPQLKQMRKRYALIMTFISALFLGVGAVMLDGLETTQSGIWLTVIILGYLSSSFACYLPFHLKVKKLKAEHNWTQSKTQTLVIDTTFRTSGLTHSNLWFSIPFIVSVVLIVASIYYYEQLPAELIIRYDLQFNPVETTAKSYIAVLSLPLVQMFVTATMLLANVVIDRSKQQIDANKPEESRAQNRLFRRRWSTFIIGSTYLLVIMFTILHLTILMELSPILLMVSTAATVGGMLLWAMLLAFTTGQGGSRLNVHPAEQEELISPDDDRYWLLGQIYFNRHDPAMFVEKRFGVGWTINFAKPLPVIILLLILILPFVLLIFL